ncbi:MAG: hypothetical protein WCI94_01565 [Rhodospirillales bacterium]
MIKIEQPAMAVHSDDVPGALYLMDYTVMIPASLTPKQVVDKIITPGIVPIAKLRFLILNCHGHYGRAPGASVATGGFGLSMGTGIGRGDLGYFRALRGIVDNIWITACGPARQTNAGAKGERLGGDGLMFCSELAQMTQAYVVAATTHQDGAAGAFMPKGYIDNYEGVVLQFGPNGNVVWQHDYGRSWIDALTHGIN